VIRRTLSYSGDAQRLRTLVGLLEAGLPLPQSIRVLNSDLECLQPQAQAALAEIVSLAKTYGSSLSVSIEALADQIESQEKLLAMVEVSGLTPRATARLILWMPVVAFALAQTLGFDIAGTVINNWAASASVLVGVVLLWLSQRIVKVMMARASSKASSLVGQFDELSRATIRLSAGVPLRQVRSADLGSEVLLLVDMSERYGLQLSSLLTKYVKRKNLELLTSVEREFALLPIKMILPVGLLALPILTFLLIIPMSITLITN